MSAHQELKIYQKAMDMFVYGYERLRSFPKAERHVMAADIRREMLALVVAIIQANRARDKRLFLRQADDHLDVLRVLVRASHQLCLLPTKHYEMWSKMLDEIGRMLGGWAKASAPPASTEKFGAQPVGSRSAAATGTTPATPASSR